MCHVVSINEEDADKELVVSGHDKPTGFVEIYSFNKNKWRSIIGLEGVVKDICL